MNATLTTLAASAMRFVHSWLNALGRILLRPTPATFRQLADDAEGKFAGLILWLVITASVNYAIGNLVTGGALLASTLFLAIILIPVAVLIWATAVHLVYQRVLRRKKEYHLEFVYVLGCIAILTLTLNTVGYAVPVVGPFLAGGAYLYGLVIASIAVQAITKLNPWPSVGAVLLGSLLGLGATACSVIFMYSLSATNAGIFGP